MNSFYETEAHSVEPDIIDNESFSDFENDRHWSSGFELRKWYKILKIFLRKLKKDTKKEDFKKILYITTNNIPSDFIEAFQKQYPDKNISVLIPVIQKPDRKAERSFEFFLQNRINQAYLYKRPRKRDNIEIWEIFSPIFAEMNNTEEFSSRLFYMAHFTKCARICALKLKPDIIHSDNIPFFLGAEFERKKYPIKTLLVINDFSIYENNKFEPFWAAINIVDKRNMRRLCRDKIIKKCVASLFNLHNTRKFYQMRECLEFIYKNYSKFRKYIDKCEDIDENILFSRMNARVLKLFPKMVYDNDISYNVINFSIKKSDFTAVVSKTYYNDISDNPQILGKMYDIFNNARTGYVSYGVKLLPYLIYQPFTAENFRDYRGRNKKYIIGEFVRDRIKTRFVDRTLFKNEDYAIRGYLDSFYEAPLIFGTFTTDLFQLGADIALDGILKLFEQYKNLQVIINIPNGLKNNYIKTWLELMEKNYSYNGRWVYIDGDINYPQFMSGADMILLPARCNPYNTIHYEAMKYGCIPIASKSGIYNDSIKDIFDDMVEGCGFKTKTTLMNDKNASMDYLVILNKAMNLYSKNPASWNLLIKNAMNYNSGWTFEVIEKYNEIYEKL